MEAMAAAKPLLSYPPPHVSPSLISSRSSLALPSPSSHRLGAGGARHPARLSLSTPGSPSPRGLAVHCATDVAETVEAIPIEKRFVAFPTVMDINQIREILPHRLGFLVDFLSHAAIVGFMGGATIVIGLQQLKGLLGITHFTSNTDVVSIFRALWVAVHESGDDDPLIVCIRWLDRLVLADDDPLICIHSDGFATLYGVMMII